MNIEIIAVGSELLLGQIVNSNARFLSEKMANIGANVFFHTVVGDNPSRLNAALETASERSDCIILTGGLGPTKDDITREAVADFVGVTLEVDAVAMGKIEEFFRLRNVTMTENNAQQAVVLSGSTVFPNNTGLAVGMAYEDDNEKIFILLPGPPSEMQSMFNSSVQEFLMDKIIEKNENQVIKSRVLRFFGIGESRLETEILDLIENQSNPTIAPLALDGEVTLRLTAAASSVCEADELLDELEKKITSRVGQFFYGYDGDTLLSEFVKMIKKRDMTVSVAESLTGGMFQELLTGVEGSSAYFYGGLVTYSSDAKIDVLGVNEKIINENGAVSPECAEAMACRVREVFKSDIGISLTGVAGPDELEGKSVGTVYIGVSLDGGHCFSRKLTLGNNRRMNRILSVKHALKITTDFLKK